MQFNRMLIEKESPEEMGYGNIKNNLTESSARDLKLKDIPVNLENLILSYGDHSGKPELREIIAQQYPGFSKDNILMTTGACLALFIINSTLLSPGDHILVMSPNYATNVEVPRSLGITVDLLKLKFENRFQLDMAEVKRLTTPKTKLISITNPHNPTGMVVPEKILEELIHFAEEKKIHLLVDETYRDIIYSTPIVPAATKNPWVISVESISKSLGIPGIRIGWIATQDKKLKERFLATKEQIVICGSVLDDEVAYAAMKNKQKLLGPIQATNAKHREIISKWMDKHPILEWVKPEGGVVLFPRIKASVKVDIPKFYQILNGKFSTFVGPGHWFECEDRHFRVGYGWPTESELRSGLESIDRALNEAKM